MTFNIESVAGLSGEMLVVKFPENSLDQKAFYTIEAEHPDFLVPFRYRKIDGQVECTYEISGCKKLQEKFGQYAAGDYVDFWSKVLQPLLDCGDWFLKPFSFVLDTQYIYLSNSGDAVQYIYVPTKQDCASHNDLQNMASYLSNQISVLDAGLEIKALRALLQGFQPKEFLKMLQEERAKMTDQKQMGPQAVKRKPWREKLLGPTNEVSSHYPKEPAQDKPTEKERETGKAAAPAEKAGSQNDEKGANDFQFDLNEFQEFFGDHAREEQEKEKKGGLFGKKEKKAKTKEKKSGLFGKKKEKQGILLSADESGNAVYDQVESNKESFDTDLERDEEFGDDVTVLDDMPESPCLHLVGDPSLPEHIPVDVPVGRSFSIGRYDVSVGRKQSDFEFDKKTKAVSRQHAEIRRERSGEYVLLDLKSSAGTFLDGNRLVPNEPYPIRDGCQISFGTSGADYIWEE